jgi:hypothetical protein
LPTGRTDRTPKKKAAFLASFEELHVVSDAAKAAGVARSTVYEWAEKDSEFAKAWDELVDRSTDLLEREAYRRAAVGVEEPVFYQGKKVGVVKRFSDTLLIVLLKARKPDMYRERVEHTGAGGGPVEHRMRLDLKGLTDEQLAALEAIQPSDDAGSTDQD